MAWTGSPSCGRALRRMRCSAPFMQRVPSTSSTRSAQTSIAVWSESGAAIEQCRSERSHNSGRGRTGLSVDERADRPTVWEWPGVPLAGAAAWSEALGDRSSGHQWGHRSPEVGHLGNRVAGGGVEGQEDGHQGVSLVEGERP